MPRERRTVAVLFSDLSGFTRLAETLDPEETQEIIDALFLRLRTEIEKRGGTVDKFMGDAVMAVFGAPVAHIDDAARAVRAALDMHQAAAALARDIGHPLKLRIGINFGEVLWGSVGGDRPTATGDAVNVAQRLETAAAPGATLVSVSVARAAGAAARCGPPRLVAVKGREEKVEACDVLGEPESLTEIRVHAPLIGREEETARLLAAVESGMATMVEGEAGIGKTRLLEEVRARFRGSRDPSEVLVGRCPERAGLLLAPFAQALQVASGAMSAPSVLSFLVRDLGATLAPIEAENISHLIAVSAGFQVPGSRVHQIDAVRLGIEVRRAWRLWLGARTARRRALLCVEDVHWADPESLALLEELAAHPIPRLALVATCRPLPAPVRGFTRFPLSTLPPGAAPALAAAVFGRPADPGLSRMLHERSGGHPYYFDELARWLERENFVAGTPATLARTPDRLPESLHGLLVAHLDALPPAAKETLKVASVFGRVFWKGALQSLCDRDPSADLDVAADRGLVATHSGSQVPGESELAFRHMLLRDAAYSLLPRRDRASFHARAAAHLKSSAASGGRRILPLAAAQFESAADPVAAAATWLAASTAAAEAYSPKEALEAAREARRLGGGLPAALSVAEAARTLTLYPEAEAAIAEILDAPEAPPDMRAEALLIRASVQQRGHGGAAALPTILAAQGLATTAALRTRIAVTLGDALARAHRFDDALAAVTPVAADLRSRPGPADRADAESLASALSTLAHIAFRRGNREESISHLEEAITLLNGAGFRHRGAGMLVNLALVRHDMGNPREARNKLQDALQVLESCGDRWSMSVARSNLAVATEACGDMEQALALFERAISECRDVENPAGETIALTGMGIAFLTIANYPGALKSFREASGIRVALGDSAGAIASRVGEGQALTDTGLWEEADRVLKLALESAESSGRLADQAQVLGALGRLYVVRSRFDEAASLARRGLEVNGTLPGSQLRAGLLNVLARAALRTGDADLASIAEALFQESRSSGLHVAIASSSLISGVLAARGGRLDDAVAFLEEARAYRTGVRMPVYQWPSADEVLLLDALGDTDAARRLAESDGAALTGCGALGLASHLRAVSAGLEGKSSSRNSPQGTLPPTP